jgi:hypothetical protein
MDRATKLHQREFDVLPETWAKLTEAYGITTAITSAIQSYPDLDRMSAPHLEEFLNDCPLMNWQKEEIKQTEKKSDYYIKAIAWHRISDARDACRAFHVFFRRNGIFIREPTKLKFADLDKLIYGALVEHEVNVQHELRPQMRDSLKKLSGEGEALLKDLELDVQNTLWDSQRV